MVGVMPAVSRMMVDLHPGFGARAYCDGDPGQLPILVISDGAAELLLLSSGSDTPTSADVAFTEELARAVDSYLARLRWLAAC